MLGLLGCFGVFWEAHGHTLGTVRLKNSFLGVEWADMPDELALECLHLLGREVLPRLR